tara:strand:+ start:975 stop:1991 length:1017 start_codon:yes stop_codon:yes gene_type:complete
MKKANSILNKIKTALDMHVELETQLLEDGVTTIEADAFEEGAEVFIVMDEERVPLAVGEYTLEDGRSLVVETDGVIAMIGEQVQGEEEGEEKVDPEVDEDLANDKPKMIVDTKIKETYFEEETPADVVDTIKEVEDEVLGEVSAIIEELTPEAVTESDASEMAVSVIEAVTSTLEEMPEEMKSKYMTKRKKYGKSKLTEEEAEVVAEVESEIVDAVAEVVSAETPEEVTPEIAEEIASVVTEALQEIVADAPEELKAQLFKKTKLSKFKKSTKSRIDMAKEKIARIKQRQDLKTKSKTSKKKITHNPESSVKPKQEFKYAEGRKESTMDRVLKSLYNK